MYLFGLSILSKCSRTIGFIIALLVIIPVLSATVPSDPTILGLSFGMSDSVVRVNNTVLDSGGNIYLAGYFTGSHMVLDGVTINKIGLQDLWVAKLNPDRSLVWLKNFGGSKGAKVVPNGLVLDGAGDLCVGGFFSGSSLSTPELCKISTNASNSDSFVLKLNTNGTTIWAKNFGGSSASSTGSCITTDSSGNLYLGGYFDLGNLTSPVLNKISRNSNWDSFVIKLSSTGETLWAKKFGGISATTKGQSITSDRSGNVLFSGQYNLGRLTTPELKRLNHDIGGNDAFLFKLDTNGEIIWKKDFGGKNANTFVYGMTEDSAGCIYMCGAFMNSSMTSPHLKHTDAGHAHKDAYVFKLDSLGNVIWAHNYGGYKAQAQFNCISVDNSGNVYLGGIFKMANLTIPNLSIIGSQDIFGMKLDSSGAITWVKNFGGTGTDASCNSIVYDSIGNVYLGGAYRSGNMNSPALAREGIADAFLITVRFASLATDNR